MANFQNILIGLIVLLIPVTAHAQEKPDLEVSVQPASDTARGGEPFAYKISVKNNGPAKADDVRLLNQHLRSGEFLSTVPSQGSCEMVHPEDSTKLVRCHFGDMETGSVVTVDVSIKLFDLGDSSIPIEKIRSPADRSPVTPEKEATERSLRLSVEAVLAAQGKTLDDDGQDPLITKLSSIYVTGRIEDEHRENNHADVTVRVLPSRNAPPRVKVVSPSPDAVVIKRAGSPFRLEIEIEAFDPDGTIEKVLVKDPFHQPRVIYEDGLTKYLFMGRTYTEKEFEEQWKAKEPPEQLAVKTGPKTYRFTLTNLEYGFNRIYITAVDNGGRRDGIFLNIIVKADPSAPAN